ncbi:hypothetical protein IV203_032297 [Nitzschia inconspicua]|uniref:Uncharacterized protein n=1 Tax=Nitzschia inconspicua TaxID=303405 RepID=A0A9K3KJT9_9STRA|nr:hypothetical protein IV203_032297 [Nitzschia inconspicua]
MPTAKKSVTTFGTSDELWENATTSPAWACAITVDLAVLCIKYYVGEVTLKQLQEQKQKHLSEQKLLFQQKERQLFVYNPFEAAFDSESLKTFRSRQVAEQICGGGFVSHKMFIKFVKAVNLMKNGDDSRNEECEVLRGIMKQVLSELDENFGRILSQGAPNSLFPVECSRDEEVQCALASEMLRFAVRKLQQKQTDLGLLPKTCPALFVSHKFDVIWTLDRESMDLLESPTQSAQSKERIACRADILCWFTHRVHEMGSCCLAYVAFNSDPEREAISDMCASNIQILHQKPCLSVDIAGGNDISR